MLYSLCLQTAVQMTVSSMYEITVRLHSTIMFLSKPFRCYITEIMIHSCLLNAVTVETDEFLTAAGWCCQGNTAITPADGESWGIFSHCFSLSLSLTRSISPAHYLCLPLSHSHLLLISLPPSLLLSIPLSLPLSCCCYAGRSLRERREHCRSLRVQPRLSLCIHNTYLGRSGAQQCGKTGSQCNLFRWPSPSSDHRDRLMKGLWM